MSGEEWANPSWLIDSCFLRLSAVCEALELQEFRRIVHEEYSKAKGSDRAFTESKQDSDGESYPVVLVKIWRSAPALESLFPGESRTTVIGLISMPKQRLTGLLFALGLT